jgi:5'-deoxynucleotidase YfbR-like HD superfamily hydrolase
MCLIHDLAESIVGDLTPKDNVSKDEKKKLEKVNKKKEVSYGFSLCV